ncbi:restriction endonuclease [Bacillus subtilis]|uniref:HNH endonuclease n=1 Tax=Bacillus subtilis TaxID=1423 RepID=UPI00201CBB7E|nr:HNH endonuclease [Bacillus subtilis]UQZ54168.1 restriction endonuclease [Bacillus subtilis]UQZ67456.1 restriction endonuclease [Bacillus subtilis PY79]UQZ71862.1 restriction endonuclease [Bacillus subtilis]
MAQPRPWLDEIIDALKELGGHGTLLDITEKIIERNVMDFNANPLFRERIRGTIYNHTSDGTYYKGEVGGETDIFFSFAGLGKGHWGLRDYEPTEETVDITEDDMGFEEGKKKLKQHIVRERNPQVIKLAKERFKQAHGRLFCEVCNFDFYETYGELGEDFIEGHHTIPVSELGEGQKTRVEDIALVCSNCHKMLHRRRPWLKKEELMKLINDYREKETIFP